MKARRYTEPQILEILGQVDAGQPLAELTRLHGVAVSTIHRWKAKYGGMTKEEIKRFRLLEEENRRLKELVADLSLDNQVLKQSGAERGGHKKMVNPDATPQSQTPLKRQVVGFVRQRSLGDGTAGVSPAGLLALHPKAQKPWRRKG